MVLYIIGAYGRSYETADQAVADWVAGKDFKIVNGPYLSIRDTGRIIKEGFELTILAGHSLEIEIINVIKWSAPGQTPKRPESMAELTRLSVIQNTTRLYCIQCKKPFSTATVKTPAGWRETQISGYCEICFDALFEDSEN